MLVAYNGHRAVAEFLLDQGAPVDARNGQGRTALMFAATGSFPETVALLLERGADPNATDQTEGWSPLMFAAAEGNPTVAEHLLEHGADPTLTDRDGETARTFAENGTHTAVVTLLDEQN
jgi:ankyrin repeat protein